MPGTRRRALELFDGDPPRRESGDKTETAQKTASNSVLANGTLELLCPGGQADIPNSSSERTLAHMPCLLIPEEEYPLLCPPPPPHETLKAPFLPLETSPKGSCELRDNTLIDTPDRACVDGSTGPDSTIAYPPGLPLGSSWPVWLDTWTTVSALSLISRIRATSVLKEANRTSSKHRLSSPASGL